MKDDAEYRAALRRIESFTGRKAGPVATVKVPRAPKTALLIGTCDGVLYTTTRVEGGRNQIQKFIHRFRAKDKPLLVASPDGSQLFLLGGRFTFGSQGIVDHSDRSA